MTDYIFEDERKAIVQALARDKDASKTMIAAEVAAGRYKRAGEITAIDGIPVETYRDLPSH